MGDLWTGLALVLVVEGLLWAAAPDQMREMALRTAAIDPRSLRLGGLSFAAVGVVLVWLIRG